ncbi:TetR/AcrR family transcriptional regulator [Luteimicrobium sp. NPDC057192]|uniref:TetR/AcrR family transcriptional regulator n=1 Tax=Luteimicrobium sp. NPDC057192 TaxID=3346042 RepID=UPI00362ED9D2
MTEPAPAQRPSRRDRYRAETRDEAKRIALDQLATGGQAALSLNAIARELGMTGPALYRYFSSRDELLTALIVDAYDDLGTTLTRAIGLAAPDGPGEQVRVLGRTMRAWALAQPHRYLLLFGTPFSGYRAPDAAIEAAQASLGSVMEAMGDFEPREGRPAAPPTILEQQLERAPWIPEELRGAIPGAVLADVILSWTRLHGLIGLEVNGQFATMGFDPALLLERELDAIVGEG